MEKVGALRLFQRSLETRKIRYRYYLGDGDSKGYEYVVDAKPYGPDFHIFKLECINHVAKRVGRRLRNMKNSVLSDGKKVFGKYRISKEVINKLQAYYSIAIRNNVGNLDQMKKDVDAIYLHHSNPDKAENHRLCPKDGWCFKKNRKIIRKDLCPSICIRAIKPIFDALSNIELLERCVDGFTQNVNEGFNALIWTRLPKNKYGGIKLLKIALYDAIICFNDGYKSRSMVFEYLGFESGENTKNGLNILDKERERNIQREKTPKRRSSRVEDQDYGAGIAN